MEARVEAISKGEASECVWLLEHPPIYTAGTSADPSELLAPTRFPVFQTGRGGRFTYHGPGQRVAYVMLDLSQARARRPRLCHLARSLADRDAGAVSASRVSGLRHNVGIFVDGAKIASIGIRVRHWVSFHGVSLNVDPNLEHFSGIVPCGLIDTPGDQPRRASRPRPTWHASTPCSARRLSRSSIRYQPVGKTLKPGGTEPPSCSTITALTIASGGPARQRSSISST